LWIPFRFLPRFYSSRPVLQADTASLLSEYRNTPFTLEDGYSEWKGDGGLLLLEKESHLLGLLQMKKSRTFWELSSFVIHNQHQRMGYGKEMLEYCLDNTTLPVCLRVKQENPAQLLYESLGFQTEGYTNGRYFMKHMK